MSIHKTGHQEEETHAVEVENGVYRPRGLRQRLVCHISLSLGARSEIRGSRV
jgi:hypothetical protein